MDIKRMIKELCIFEDIFERLNAISQGSCYLLIPNALPTLVEFYENPVIKEDIIDFCNQTEIIIIKYKPELARLFEYLDIKKLTFTFSMISFLIGQLLNLTYHAFIRNTWQF